MHQQLKTSLFDQANKALSLLSRLRPFMSKTLERSNDPGGHGHQLEHSDSDSVREDINSRSQICAELVHSLILRGNSCAEI